MTRTFVLPESIAEINMRALSNHGVEAITWDVENVLTDFGDPEVTELGMSLLVSAG